jgi:uncharacterized protein with PIN domain
VKVFKYGHIKPAYAFCVGCGAVLEFERKEGKMSKIALQKGRQHDGKDCFVNCPVCGRAIYEKDWEESVDNC